LREELEYLRPISNSVCSFQSFEIYVKYKDTNMLCVSLKGLGYAYNNASLKF